MTGFRYWLADLISGGELTRRKMNFLREWIALLRIAAEVNPTSNATVKRMGRIAHEALK